MKTNKLLILVTAVLLITNLVMAYFLWTNKKDRGHSRERKQERGDWIVRELKLDDNQKEEHKKLRDAHFNSMKPVFDSISASRRILYEQIKNANADDSIVNFYSGRIGRYHSEITRLTFDHFREMRSILRPEQQVKLDSLMQKVVSDMGNRRRK